MYLYCTFLYLSPQNTFNMIVYRQFKTTHIVYSHLIGGCKHEQHKKKTVSKIYRENQRGFRVCSDFEDYVSQLEDM